MAEGKARIQEFQLEVKPLHKANSVATPLKGVVTRLERELADARAQSKGESKMLQTRGDADQDLLRAAARDRRRLQLFDGERQKYRNVERTEQVCKHVNAITRHYSIRK